ncbi:ATP-binding protein [Hydrogenophaga sp. T2]|uniref:sensor histidine kinase n=1 Tax=Hydrogenophaga sp. T2 TaxID=3132823 RepID=UPI003CE8BE67
MYSLLPALVAGLFLGYGFHVIVSKGFNRGSGIFFLLCLTTFLWQAAWAVLYQTRDPATADLLVRLGYMPILFLPTCYYHFIVETAKRRGDLWWVRLSYVPAFALLIVNASSGLFVEGHYTYFFGYYPKAGPLHGLHVLQTVAVGLRSFWVSWQAGCDAPREQRTRFKLCAASLVGYFFAAGDYLCNYGFSFYPPGVIFIAISLGLIVLAVTRHQLMNPVAVAASVVHEMRTPLASIRMQAEALAQWLPELDRGYRMAVDEGLLMRPFAAPDLGRLCAAARAIARHIDRSNLVIDLTLAAARMERIDRSGFTRCSMRACVREAIDSYPFRGGEREKLKVETDKDFEFVGSEPLMVYVLFNLFKNALYAMHVAGKGDIQVTMERPVGGSVLVVRDTATGIRNDDMGRIFESFFTTKSTQGVGLGLAFCRRVVESFGGSMACESVEGEYTAFSMRFPTPPIRTQQSVTVPLTSNA